MTDSMSTTRTTPTTESQASPAGNTADQLTPEETQKHNNRRRLRAQATPAQENAARVLIAVFATTLALTVVFYFVGGRLSGFALRIVYGTINIPATTSLVSILVLALLVGALLRRKRMALYIVASFQILGFLWSAQRLASVLVGTFSPPTEAIRVSPERLILVDSLAIIFGLTVPVILWWVRPAFPARVQRGSFIRASLIAICGSLISVGIAFAIMEATAEERSVLRAFGAVVRNSLGVAGVADRHVLHTVGHGVPVLLEICLSATFVLAIWAFLRSSGSPQNWTGMSEVAVRELLAQHGQADSLGYFATRRDRSYSFSDDQKAVLAYRVVGSVALASGDPIGEHTSWKSAVDNWLESCREYGWIPAVTSVGAEAGRFFAARGFGIVPLGDEAILHPDRFTLDSTSMTSVRQAVTRARRAGLTVTIRRHSDLTEAEMAEMIHLADSWRIGGPERGFSMALERLGDPADGRCVLVMAHTKDGKPVGMLSLVPWGRTGLSLDVMRRSPEAPNGVTELMVAELMDRAESLGLIHVSLNFAVARSVFADADELGASPFTRAGSGLLGLVDRFTQIESLYRNNDRYRPEWVPRYVCFEGAAALPAVALAIGAAEGFLPLPGRNTSVGNQLTPFELERASEAERITFEVAAVEPRRSNSTRHRMRHLDALCAAGRNPYTVGRPGGEALATLSAQTPDNGTEVHVHARVRSVRRHGGVIFVTLIDNGVQAQAILERDTLGADQIELFGRNIDTGDLLSFQGHMGTSRNGTSSIIVSSWDIAAKALHPVPYGGLTDPGQRARARTMDLLVHPQAAAKLRARSRAIGAVRSVLLEEGYLEVETPMLQSTNGGATARPFRTFSNAYGTDLVMRIAPELALKRLLAGDMGPVFEIGRNFRNEGADLTHNPEFTVLEAYRPFSDYNGMRLLTQRVIQAAARAVHGAEVIPLPMGPEDENGNRTVIPVDISGDWPVISVADAVSEKVGQRVSHTTDLETLLALARKHEVAVANDMGPGAVLEELYAELVEGETVYPTFYVDFPVETSPLTGPHRSVPGLVERWDLVIRGAELGTAYSELNDPIEQRRRLTEQSLKAAAGNVEAMEVDEDFLAALEVGMPPAGGLGIGLDRLVMMLTESNIREVLSFPFVRPRQK